LDISRSRIVSRSATRRVGQGTPSLPSTISREAIENIQLCKNISANDLGTTSKQSRSVDPRPEIVRCRIIIGEDFYKGLPPHRRQNNKRNQIGFGLVQLTKLAIGIRAGCVEIAKRNVLMP